MDNLKEVLLNPDRRTEVVSDCVRLVEDEVAAKRGLAGVAVKGAFAVLRKARPGLTRDAVERLLDEFVDRLQPFYGDFMAQEREGLEPYLAGRAPEVAHALLGVTDARASRVTNQVIKKAYDKLRPSAVKHVEVAVPGIAKVIAKHA